jgi:hypothetical protein
MSQLLLPQGMVSLVNLTSDSSLVTTILPLLVNSLDPFRTELSMTSILAQELVGRDMARTQAGVST